MRLSALIIPGIATQVLRLILQINLPFHNHQVIGPNAQSSPCDPFHDAGEIASCIDHPFGALLLKFGNEFLKIVRHGWILALGVQGSVKIGRDQFYGQTHIRAAKCRLCVFAALWTANDEPT